MEEGKLGEVVLFPKDQNHPALSQRMLTHTHTHTHTHIYIYMQNQLLQTLFKESDQLMD